MTFSGDLKGIQLADVIQNVFSNRLTGVLEVKTRERVFRIWFCEGLIAGAAAGDGKELPLLATLQQRGHLDAKQIDAIEKRHRRSKKSLQEQIAALELLPDDLVHGTLVELVEEEVFAAMLQKTAEFRFEDGEPKPGCFDAQQVAAGLRLDPAPLVIEGARRVDETERIQRVITADGDRFVLIKDVMENEFDATTLEVAKRLDGRLSVGDLVRELPVRPFLVRKAVSDLVQQGYARGCTGDELAAGADEALQQGDSRIAIELLTTAVRYERNHQQLRDRLAGLLEAAGRTAEAASELALLGFQAAQNKQWGEALARLEKAVALNPGDLAIQERRLELLVAHGNVDTHTAACAAFAETCLQTGLAERAKKALEAGLKRHENPVLLAQMAEVEGVLGNVERAVGCHLRLAELGGDDDGVVLTALEAAAAIAPDDQVLQRRIQDLRSGARRRRRERRLRFLRSAIASTILIALCLVGVAELTASRVLVRALHDELPELARGRIGEAVTQLDALAQGLRYTLAGREAGELRDELIELQIEAAATLVAAGRAAEARTELTKLLPQLEREDFLGRAQILLAQAERELAAAAVLAVAEQRGDQDEAALQALAALTDARLIAFHLRHLPHAKNHTKRALLDALLAIDSGRGLGQVALLFVRTGEWDLSTRMRKLLDRGERYRAQGGDREWSTVYPELEKAKLDPELAERAREALGKLRGK